MSRGRPFEPGQSGNPGGRPSTADISSIARRYTVDIVRAGVDVMRLDREKHDTAVVRAAEFMADLAYPGWRRGALENSALELLHMHLLAVQGMPPPSLEPQSVPESAQADNMLPDSRSELPEEALPLWDAAVRGMRE